jgi:hypothetical protein
MVIIRTKEITKITARLTLDNIDAIGDHFGERKQANH